MKTEPSITDERPAMLQRWLGVLPLVLSLGTWVFAAPYVLEYAGTFHALRVNLPIPMRAAYFLVVHLEKIWPLTLSALLLFSFHFGWGCRTTQRLMWLNIVWMFLLVLAVFALCGGSLMCMAKLAEALSRR